MALLTVALLTRWLYLRDDSTCYRWALYTEKLAREFGFFKTEPDGSEGYDLLGHFGDELMRAARLAVDTASRGCTISAGLASRPLSTWRTTLTHPHSP